MELQGYKVYTIGYTWHKASQTSDYSGQSLVGDLMPLRSQEKSEDLVADKIYCGNSILRKSQQKSERLIGVPFGWCRRASIQDFILMQGHDQGCSYEADELCRTLEDSEEIPRTASEMADVLYHAMVSCRDSQDQALRKKEAASWKVAKVNIFC
ncbi:Phosphoribosyl-ATP diphosphatase [Heracleum sosnowskyi]|uniref:Phosphoribosyl-ATP diphosphatase n=1 Tax=Heracleum sosnowskyi TaxID=360622 RepID=A0AAD8HI12_9APIA|nr:Phosphoribosyl-ATP diphosphatase [Heracleum sosnowskyi]